MHWFRGFPGGGNPGVDPTHPRKTPTLTLALTLSPTPTRSQDGTGTDQKRCLAAFRGGIFRPAGHELHLWSIDIALCTLPHLFILLSRQSPVIKAGFEHHSSAVCCYELELTRQCLPLLRAARPNSGAAHHTLTAEIPLRSLTNSR